MPSRRFRTTRSFSAAAVHLQRYCGIDEHLASLRLHEIKRRERMRADEDVVFDFSGGVYTNDGVWIGSLTEGGSGEQH